MNIYKRGNKYLVIVPDLPQWFVVDRIGKTVLDSVNKGMSLGQIQAMFPQKINAEITTTHQDLLQLIHGEQSNKKDRHIIERALTSRATVAMIGVTKACNLKCPHCYVDAVRSKRKELFPVEHQKLAKEIFNNFALDPSIVYKVNLTGGEPFLRPDIMEIISSYREAGFIVNMSTNGLLIKNCQLKPLKEMEVDLAVSLDGATKNVHDAIRGPGTHQ